MERAAHKSRMRIVCAAKRSPDSFWPSERGIAVQVLCHRSAEPRNMRGGKLQHAPCGQLLELAGARAGEQQPIRSYY
jgi:hypothetical protein